MRESSTQQSCLVIYTSLSLSRPGGYLILNLSSTPFMYEDSQLIKPTICYGPYWCDRIKVTPAPLMRPERTARYTRYCSSNFPPPPTPTPTTMATAADSFLKGSTGRNTRGLLRITILCLIAAAAVASRLFSVIRTWSSSHLNYLFSLPISSTLELAVPSRRRDFVHYFSVILLLTLIILGFESIIHEC